MNERVRVVEFLINLRNRAMKNRLRHHQIFTVTFFVCVDLECIPDSGRPESKKHSISAGLRTLLDSNGLNFGGGGGN